ncbi:MAG: hypothetical protein ABSG68_01970 [Thermoguttaceae bacterium]|jgi:hypothetical protein
MPKKPETKRFTVEVKELWCHAVEVKLPANATRQQIIDAANEKIATGDDGDNTEYDYTLDSDKWNVRDEGGNLL